MLQKPTTRLPINTAEEMFEKLKWEETRLVETWSVYDSYNFIVTAHHLFEDWICKGYACTVEQQHRAQNLPSEAKCVFDAVKDISNGSKHFKLTQNSSLKNQIVTEVTESGCFGYDSYVEGDMVHFAFSEYFVSMGELSALVMRYMAWIIDGEDGDALAEMAAALEGMKVSPET